MLAKMAADLHKPDGLTVIDDADIPGRLLDLPISDFPGIGSQLELRLKLRGIGTVEQLYRATKSQLHGAWGGIEGERMYERLRGASVPLPIQKNQTVGHSHVLPPFLRTQEKAHAVLHKLLQKAAMRLRDIGHYSGGLTVWVSYRNGVKWYDDLRFNETQDTVTLTAALNQLWRRRPWELLHAEPMQLGLVLTHLLEMRGHTLDLFEQPKHDARERLNHAVDTVNQTFGHGSVYFGGAHGVIENAPMRISFTCIPKPEIEEIDPKRERRLRPLPPKPAEAESPD